MNADQHDDIRKCLIHMESALQINADEHAEIRMFGDS